MIGEGLLVGALIWLLGTAFFRSRKPVRHSVPDPPEPFYHAYTTAFDRVCRGAELRALLDREGRDVRAGHAVGAADPDERRRQFDAAHAVALADEIAAPDLSCAAICILFDQSGSMAPVMPRIAGEILGACEHLERAGADVMVAGFTTVGWKGGQSREQWLEEGSPPYPGRLCDLLHVVYAEFGESSKPELLAPLCEPAICFENVDGEAIIWAEQRLLSNPREQRCLIIVSDGAPVDDSSLSANGPNFLWNHLEKVVGDTLSRGDVEIGGIGIDHRVERLYLASRMVGTEGGLAAAIIELTAELIAKDQPSPNDPGNTTSAS